MEDWKDGRMEGWKDGRLPPIFQSSILPSKLLKTARTCYNVKMHIMNIFTLLPQTIQEILDWRSFLDIVLIAMGLFFLYQTLRRLGTRKIVLGILIAVAVFIVARLLELKGIEWIYSNLTSVAVIALIVIFQPELRKIFGNDSPCLPAA